MGSNHWRQNENLPRLVDKPGQVSLCITLRWVLPSELDLRSPQERQGHANIFNVGMDEVVFDYNQGIQIPIQSQRQVVESGSWSQDSWLHNAVHAQIER